MDKWAAFLRSIVNQADGYLAEVSVTQNALFVVPIDIYGIVECYGWYGCAIQNVLVELRILVCVYGCKYQVEVRGTKMHVSTQLVELL